MADVTAPKLGMTMGEALADTPPERRRLPILPVFPTPDDPKRAQLLARGDETIVIQTLTEVITATIVVAVPR